jgi:hypothetical protein
LYGNGPFGFILGAKDLVINGSEVFSMGNPTMWWENFRVKDGYVGSCVE